MILIIETCKVYNEVFSKEQESKNYTNEELKNMQEFLKKTDENLLSDLAAKEFATWNELSEAMKERGSLPGSFFIKEIKKK